MTSSEGNLISPRECSLCFGIPLTKAEFFDASDETRFDWIPARCNEASEISKISYGQAVEKEWQRYMGSGIYDILNALADAAESKGVIVKRNADFTDLQYSLEKCKTTILIAHWCHIKIVPENVLEADQIITLAAESSHWTLKEINLSLNRHKKYAHGDARVWVEKALSFLVDRTIKKREKALKKTFFNFSMFNNSPDIGRPWLEYVLGEKLRHSKPLELRDKMHSAESIWNLIPTDKNRILDLSSCNATELSQIISVERRLCRAIAPYQSSYPQLAAHLIGKTINNLDNVSYFDARIKALNEIKNLFDI